MLIQGSSSASPFTAPPLAGQLAPKPGYHFLQQFSGDSNYEVANERTMHAARSDLYELLNLPGIRRQTRPQTCSSRSCCRKHYSARLQKPFRQCAGSITELGPAKYTPILLVDQVWKPPCIVPRLSPPPIFGLWGSKWSVLGCSREVDWLQTDNMRCKDH